MVTTRAPGPSSCARRRATTKSALPTGGSRSLRHGGPSRLIANVVDGRDLLDAVVGVGREVGRDEPDAATLDPMGPGRFARDHRRLGRATCDPGNVAPAPTAAPPRTPDEATHPRRRRHTSTRSVDRELRQDLGADLAGTPSSASRLLELIGRRTRRSRRRSPLARPIILADHTRDGSPAGCR